jgi:hypothetical protein
MRLLFADIENFRSIQSQRIIFSPSCRVLVGINESGKTNVLRALHLLDSEETPNVDDIRDPGPSDNPDALSYVRFVFALTEEERMEGYKSLLAKVSGARDEPILHRGGKKLTLKELFKQLDQLLYIVTVRDGKRRFSTWAQSESKVLEGWYRPTQGAAGTVEIDGKARSLSSFELISPTHSRTLPAGVLTTPLTAASLNNLVGAEISSFVKMPSVVFWRYDEENLLPGEIPLQSFADSPSTCLPLKHMFTLAGHIDISTAISVAQEKKNGVSNLLTGVARATTSHITRVWKEIKGLSVELIQNGPNIEATVKDTYNKFDLSRRSDGFKRFISFLLLVSVKARNKQLTNTLYLHDEPDTSLHPAGARYLREELLRLSDKNYVVYSTHSIFMIDRENIRRHLIVRKRNEVTSITEVTESNFTDEEVIYNALGYSIFEHLRPKNIVFEGWRDKRLFQVQVGKFARNGTDRKTLTEAGKCHARGVKDIMRITPMLELARVKWIVVSDADAPAREHQKAYEGEGEWFRYDQLGATGTVVTAEDFIKWGAFGPVVSRLAKENSSLSIPSDWDHVLGIGKMEKMKGWMRSAGLSLEDSKQHLNSIKDDVFGKLKASEIEDDYLNILQTLAAKLRGLS